MMRSEVRAQPIRAGARVVLRALAAFALVASCGVSPSPRRFTLSAVDGEATAGEPVRVLVRQPSIPRYLDRQAIVRRTGAQRLVFDAKDIWGAPLHDLVGRVLAEDLAQRLPEGAIFLEGGAIHARPDVTVEVDLRRFEAVDDRAVHVAAMIAVRWVGEDRSRIERVELRRVAKGTTRGQVEALSAALADLSDVVAGMIARPGPSAPSDTGSGEVASAASSSR